MRCSCKRSAALMCSVNLIAALYILHLLLGSIVTRPPPPRTVSLARRYDRQDPNGLPLNRETKFTAGVMEKLKEAAEARRAMEPIELMKRVREMQLESAQGVLPDGSRDTARENVAEGVAQRLQELKGNYGLPKEESVRSLEEPLLKLEMAGTDEFGKPVDASSKSDKEDAKSLLDLQQLDGGKLVLKGPEIEDGIIPGRLVPDICNAEPHTDYDGLAVRWGLNNPQESAADCCQACLDQARTAPAGAMKCNVWVYCPAEEGCFSPDIYEHKQFECWLKQADKPNTNFKGRYPPEYRKDHPNCPQVVPWVSGVL